MYQLKKIPPVIQIDYGIASQFPDSALRGSFSTAEKRWDHALILALAYATGAGETIPKIPAKSLHYFQLSTRLTRTLDDNTVLIALATINSVFGEVMGNNRGGLSGDFQRAILNDMRLTPEARDRLGVRDINDVVAEFPNSIKSGP